MNTIWNMIKESKIDNKMINDKIMKK